MIKPADPHLKTLLPEVDIPSRYLFPGVFFLLSFRQRPVQSIGFQGGDLSIFREIGIDVFTGVKGGDGYVARLQDGRHTPEEAAFSSREMAFGPECATGYIVRTPCLAHHEIVVQDQSLSEGKSVITDDS